MVSGIRSPRSSDRTITNCPALALRATRGAFTSSRVTSGAIAFFETTSNLPIAPFIQPATSVSARTGSVAATFLSRPVAPAPTWEDR